MPRLFKEPQKRAHKPFVKIFNKALKSLPVFLVWCIFAAPPVWAQNGIVDGTAGNDNMALGFTDADGDQVTAGADIIEGNAGDDSFVADDTEAHGDTLRGGSGIDVFQNNYNGSTSNTSNDIHIDAATTFDSVEVIDGNNGSTTDLDLRLDGTGTFDLTSVTDFRQIGDIVSDATTGAITVLLPNLNENLSGTFFLNSGADVTFVYGTNVTDRRAFVTLGSGNDTVTGGRGNDTITLGGGSDTVVLYDGFNDGLGGDDILGFTAGGDDQLDVSAMTDTSGGPVTADDMTVQSLTGGKNTRLIFPNGERLRLDNVAFADMNEESELAAAGIPLRNQLEVSNTNDSGGGSLRAAIEFANANPTEDTITFDIPGTGPHVIALDSPLPNITDADINIDGLTQPGASCGSTTNANGGISDRALQIQIDGTAIGGNSDNDTVIVNAANVTVSAIAVYGAQDVPFVVNGGDNFTLICSHIGVDAGGLTTYSNNDSAMWIASADNVQIGDGTLSGLNIFGGGSFSGLEFDASGPSNAPIIKRNLFGLGIDGITPVANTIDGLRLEATTNAVIGDALGGGNVMSGNGEDGIMVRLGASATILGNFVGTNGIGTTIVQNGDEGIAIETSGTSATIGDGSVAGQNIIGGNLDANIDVLDSSSAVIDNNLIGIGAGGQPMGGLDGIYMSPGSSASIRNNIISNNSSDGIVIFGNASAAIYANSIFNNAGQAIDLGGNNVSLNDVGDGDSGPNDLLNFPVINSVSADGSASLNYDITLDVPANTPGYRIDFFKNSAADPTGHGEGEIYLGTIDVSGPGNHTGSFTAGVTISVGDIISTTTTRKTASSFDITSEFSETVASISSVSPLVVTSVADTNTLGTLRYAINNSSANDTISFNITGAGPHVISPTSALPNLSNAGVTIDGETQPGASCGQLTTDTPHDLRIQIDGANAGALVSGLQTNAQDVTFRGLSITNFDEYGIGINFGGDNFIGECLHVGVAPDGLTKGSNAKSSNRTPGLRLFTVSNGIIRNSLLSGNDDDPFDIGLRYQSVTGGIISGNIIGLDSAGSTSLPNGSDGILLDGTTSGITIGGPTSETRNIISGNGSDGISIDDNVSNINILGNYIGLGLDGITALGNGTNGITANGASNINIGDGTNNGRNIISHNTIHGITLSGTIDGIIIDANYIGLATDGTTARGNGVSNAGSGIYFSNAISDGDIIRNNVISDNSDAGIAELDSTISNLSITSNYIGTDATGLVSRGNDYFGIALYGNDVISTTIGAPNAGNVISGTKFGPGIEFYSGSHTIQGNFFGVGADGTTAIPNSTWGMRLYDDPVAHIIGGIGAGEGNIIANTGTGYVGLLIQNGATATVSGNTLRDGNGYAAVNFADTGTNVTFHDNIITGDTGDGILASSGAQLTAYNNTISGNTGDGVNVSGTAAIYGNNIHNNGGLGINLSFTGDTANGVTANDGGDGDNGPNDLLNFPLINEIGADGTSSISYDITLDVPANTPGYRIDFFKNSAADPTGHGEGEIYLGTIEVSGAGNHTGSLSAGVTVGIGNIISATTTRKTGSLTYDITSEFSQNAISVDANPASLTVIKTVEPLNTGDYDLPGSDVIYSLAVTNEGDGAVDTDSIVLIDSVPSEIIFFYGDHDGSGPSTDIIGFEETGTSLSFNANTDALFDDGNTKPTNLSECDYMPVSGYDPNVKYVCFNPKGQMLGGDPNPNFEIRFRGKIR